jgi:alkanesulfonate monooxygenase SsuD/methylene tetrahydromethanopterin reductase-like flavin-dependent oxidoreductase (luciferase family)
VPFDTRGGRLNEFLRLLRHLWTTPEKGWEGKHFQVPPVGLARPLTPGGPPIYVGASGPAGLRRAARYGDGYISTGHSPQDIAGIRARLLEMRRGFGREVRFPVFTQVSQPASPEDAERMVAEYADAGADGLILSGGFEQESALPGPEVARALVEAAAR